MGAGRYLQLAIIFAAFFSGLLAASQQIQGPIQIIKGGTYSGTWKSNDPRVAAVSIHTDQPVILRDAVITSKGPLITVTGVKKGANVIIEDVTGYALDPGVAGLERGSFVQASNFLSLIVKNCTMYGANSGIMALGGSPATLKILNNQAINLEDRASDGRGGLTLARPRLGHFILLNNISAVHGAEIAWNRDVQAIGQTSTEDAINIYESEGSKTHPIWVHDNYIEGSSAPTLPGKHYTGTALIADGAPNASAKQTAYVKFENNEIVATAGSGIGIAYGHDIKALNNRIVSCGVTSGGLRYAWGASAVVIWNYYKDKDFYNNTISGTSGGMVGPGPKESPRPYNSWKPSTGPETLREEETNSISNNSFTNPCIQNDQINLGAESAEREHWLAKASSNHELIGDQHLTAH